MCVPKRITNRYIIGEHYHLHGLTRNMIDRIWPFTIDTWIVPTVDGVKFNEMRKGGRLTKKQIIERNWRRNDGGLF